MKKNKNLDGLDEINVYYGLTVLVLSFKRRFCGFVNLLWLVGRSCDNQKSVYVKKKSVHS